MKQILLFTLFSLVLFPHFTSGQIPQTMSYQGVLTNVNGIPVTDGSYSLTFKLYDVSTNGDSLWQETQNVQVTSGLFNVILGSVSPLNLPFDKQYWLGIIVASGTELTPRTALTASPYSLNSHSTLAEPQPGQGLTIRNSSGEATHQFDVNGDVTHNGVGKFFGGILVGDTTIIPADTGSYKSNTAKLVENSNTHSDQVNIPAVGNATTGSNIGVLGQGGNKGVQGQSENGIGVFGFSQSNYGIYGLSKDNSGVRGFSENSYGVEAISKLSPAIYGYSYSNYGVHGFSSYYEGVHGNSINYIGVVGTSINHIGVLGSSTDVSGVVGKTVNAAGVWGESINGSGIYGQGQFGGWFQNKVKMIEVPEAPNQERFLVWDADSVVKYRTLPSINGFDGILQDKAFILKSGETEVFRVDTNGNSYHKGVETFDDDVIFKGANYKGAKLVDANGNTLAGFGRMDLETGQRIGVYGKAEISGDLAGAFDGDVEVNGEVVAGSFHVVNGNGDTLTSFNADGTSTHSGLETYQMGIKTTLNNGNIIRIDPAEGFTIKTPAGQFIAHIRYDGAAYFAGNVSKGGGSFKIDHPLDPENKFLYHSFVESPDMMNIYNGNVTLNNNGEADVELPAWFEALNKDFRYQLTAIGAPGPNLYVAEKISDNHFKISGGTEGMEVSWEVTGIRRDAYAEKYRIPVEELKKGEEIGNYLHPDAFGLSKEQGITFSNPSELKHVGEGYKNKD